MSKEKSNAVTFTYIGAGFDSPQIIEFMGKIVFQRGIPLELEVNKENAKLIAKLSQNPSFKEGVVPATEIMEADKKEKVRVAEAKKDEAKVNASMKRSRIVE